MPYLILCLCVYLIMHKMFHRNNLYVGHKILNYQTLLKKKNRFHTRNSDNST
jgi:hypothetical protein